ncbi:MAG: glycerophosphoryl diester phosphodiesterase [Mycobacterium sp.]|nr:glycerophosphoryl diester phosphodiesterase [Mycobacterium sp.]
MSKRLSLRRNAPAPILAMVLVGLLGACGASTTGNFAASSAPSSAPTSAATTPTPSPTTAGKEQWFGRQVVAVTHNGGEYEFPQDTLFALRSAQALNMQVLDVDIQMSKDDVPVLIHSETLDSSTSGHGNVSDYTAAQLAQLDAAYQWTPGCGTCSSKPAADHPDRGIRTGAKPLPAGAKSRDDFGVPTLEEVFQQFPDAYLDVELKPESDAAPKVAALLHKYHREDRTIVASFDDKQMTQFQQLAPTVATSPGQTASTNFFLGKPLPAGFQVLQLPYRYELAGKLVTVITPSLVTRAHAAGLAVWVWDQGATPGKALYQTLIGLGVDGILASVPSDLLSVLQTDHKEWSGA